MTAAPDRERLERFLRTLVGLLLVGWLLAALVAPPDPFTFLLYLAPLWVLAVPVAAHLVYRGGYEQLRASGLYDPGLPAATAAALFVGVVVVLKVGLTLAGNAVLDRDAVGHATGVVLSAIALVAGYLFVYTGAAAWLTGRR